MIDNREKIIAENATEWNEDCRSFGEVMKDTWGSSPIEEALSNALEKLFENFGGGGMRYNDSAPIEEIQKQLNGFNPPFLINVFREVGIGPYKVDFLISRRPGGHDLTKFCVIECDGHEFHERTKKQAEHDKKRDRFLQAEGFPVLRLTGSEIWRDPMKTAWGVLLQAVETARVPIKILKELGEVNYNG